jgi:hypothetical protein
MEDRELSALIDQECQSALGIESSKLSDQRADAMKRYYGEPYGNEEPDRSSVVTREVMDTVEWIKPELMKLFASGGDTVRFEPETPDDVPAADQATDYINYLIHRRNPGFRIIYEWITDGLLQKDGIVKCWWDDGLRRQREEYAGISEAEMLALAMDERIEVVQQQSYDDPSAVEQREKAVQAMNQQMEQMQAQLPPEQLAQMQQQMQAQLDQPIPQVYDVAVIRESRRNAGVRIENVPPEEFISSGPKSVQDAAFNAHRREITISELREMGYDFDEEELPSSSDNFWANEEKLARHQFDGTEEVLRGGTWRDPSMREVEVIEAYIRCDYDEDGVAELRKVVKVGDVILENEEVDCAPFCHWTPIIIPHKLNGLSVADLVVDLQRIQSQLFRNMLDNQYALLHGRYEVLDGQVNLDDLLTSRPHGIVRTKMQGAVKRLDTPELPQSAFQMLGYVDQLRERRTGVSERTQGLDQNQLNSNTAATAVNQVMTAAQQRIELIARVFAETGLTDLFRLMYKLVLQNQTAPDIVRLRDQYVEVNPSDWRDRHDVSVVVGLGNGSRESEMLHLNMVFQNQMTLAQNPQYASLVQPQNIYEVVEDQVKVLNKASAGRYFTDPRSPAAQQAAQQAQQQQMQMQQIQQQMQQMQMQLMERQTAVQESEAKVKALQVQLQDEQKQRDLQRKEAELQEERRQHNEELGFDYDKLQTEAALEAQQNRGVDIGG